MSELLENAFDSLRMAVRHYLDEELETADKWAILETFHTVELLLKERLRREHWLLIYSKVDAKINDDSRTVGLGETLARFANLGIDVPEKYRKILTDLQKRRNRIEHHRFLADESHRYVLGEALKFISYFLEEHLEEDLELHLSVSLFEKIQELILSYEQLVSRAESEAQAILGRYSPKEQTMIDLAFCPECGNQSLVVGAGEDEDRCYFCRERIPASACVECGEYFVPDELLGAGICSNCFSYRIDRE